MLSLVWLGLHFGSVPTPSPHYSPSGYHVQAYVSITLPGYALYFVPGLVLCVWQERLTYMPIPSPKL